MANQWFKFYGGEYLSDPKINSLNVGECQCWTVLMCHANLTGNCIKYVTEESIMIQAKINPLKSEWKDTTGVFNKFIEMGMMVEKDGTIRLKNWKKRQEVRSESYERVQKWREKRNVTETLQKRSINGKKREEENRTDKSVSPAQEAKSFFEGNSESIFTEFLEKTNAPPEVLKKEFQKFTLYWTEKDKSGTREKWQQQDTFEVRRRLATWLGRVNDFQKVEISKGRGLA